MFSVLWRRYVFNLKKSLPREIFRRECIYSFIYSYIIFYYLFINHLISSLSLSVALRPL